MGVTETGLRLEVPEPSAMRTLGQRLAGLLRAGDLLILTGSLGAGKTTFTQGLADGLGVRGRVTSPTFIVAREHPPAGAGPGLVHVDAYRLTGPEELDDLDLDSQLEDDVVVVEWGAGKAEQLAESRLEITIDRETSQGVWTTRGEPRHADDGGSHGIAEVLDEPRLVTVRAVGPAWTERTGALAEAARV